MLIHDPLFRTIADVVMYGMCLIIMYITALQAAKTTMKEGKKSKKSESYLFFMITFGFMLSLYVISRNLIVNDVKTTIIAWVATTIIMVIIGVAGTEMGIKNGRKANSKPSPPSEQ